MRKQHIADLKIEDEENEINLTPMLDVVFIMLIFFIVTATFIRETGIDANRPDPNQEATQTEEEGAILVIIDNNDEFWINADIIDPRMLRARIQAMHAEDTERPMVIQAEPQSTTAALVAALDAANQVGVENVSITEAP